MRSKFDLHDHSHNFQNVTGRYLHCFTLQGLSETCIIHCQQLRWSFVNSTFSGDSWYSLPNLGTWWCGNLQGKHGLASITQKNATITYKEIQSHFPKHLETLRVLHYKFRLKPHDGVVKIYGKCSIMRILSGNLIWCTTTYVTFYFS